MKGHSSNFRYLKRSYVEDVDLAHLSLGERAGLKAGHGRTQNRAQHMREWFLLEQLPDNKRELQNAHH